MAWTTPLIDAEEFSVMQIQDGVQSVFKRLKILERENDDGLWSMKFGKKGDEFTIRTIRRLASAAAAKTKRTVDYIALLTGESGEYVTLTDQDNRTWSNIILKSFRVIEDRTVPGIVSNAHTGNRKLVVDWTCQQGE